MPDRRGKSEKRRQTREQNKYNSERKERNNDDRINSIDWSVVDYDDENDFDECFSDDYGISNKSTTSKSQRFITTRNYQHNIKTKSSAETKTEYYFHDRQPPSRIFNIFPNMKSNTEVMKLLKGIQDEEERYCQPKDEYGNRTTTKILNPFPREPIIEHFKRVDYTNFDTKDGKQILKYLKKPILRTFQYGILLFDSEKQIFIVQNHDGIWNAPMSHRKIEQNFQLETINETVFRAFNEQICAKHQLTDEIFESYDLQEQQHLNSHKYIENDQTELIGLFISEFDDPIIEFELRDTFVNQACQWISIDDVIKHVPENQLDIYGTLRSFVEHIQRGTDLNKTNSNNDVSATITTLNINTAPLKRFLSIRDAIFDRAQQCLQFENEYNQALDENLSGTLLNNYAPKILGSSNFKLHVHEDHLNIYQYEKCILEKLQIPYYNQPKLNSKFPHRIHNGVIPQARKTSILPILIMAQRYKVDIHKYDIICERNSLRNIAMNKNLYVMGVKKIGKTFFLRRHDKRFVDKNQAGYRFEQMCIREYNSSTCFKQLVEGNIGTFKTLITAETDAIDEQTHQGIELKSRYNSIDIYDQEDSWLQTFLSDTRTIIVGKRTSEEPPRLVNLHEYNVSSISDDKVKNKILLHLYRVLCFLQQNVKQDGIYLLSRHYDPNLENHNLYLYKVAEKDEQELTFITQQILAQLCFRC
ncbi:unnamed protein product [Adineta steineri]|uniref:Decapping nuclease n=1 Tax=Adineta steineri TaxID=433720 RepID=A0A819RFE8_9BILA|nr:unnamed protein product [Adineta steineri]